MRDLAGCRANCPRIRYFGFRPRPRSLSLGRARRLLALAAGMRWRRILDFRRGRMMTQVGIDGGRAVRRSRFCLGFVGLHGVSVSDWTRAGASGYSILQRQSAASAVRRSRRAASSGRTDSMRFPSAGSERSKLVSSAACRFRGFPCWCSRWLASRRTSGRNPRGGPKR